MGSVWCATHLGLAQQVAIKLVAANFVRSSEALRRFDREAKAAAKIRSRHVPQVFDNGVLEDGTPFLAMELLHGESLFKRIHRQGPLPLPEVVSILDQCCRGLSRAHALGIVHRDIKPDNIFLAQSVDEEGYVVKILDFGVAKFTVLGDAEHSSTRTGTLVGTPQYMSPEQARGLKTIDARSDIYSLGLVAYTMLTGNLAFSGESLGDLLLQICTQALPSLRAAAPWLPPAMEEWFQRACARDVDHRYPSAQAFVDALHAATGAGPAGPRLTVPTTAIPISTTGEASSVTADGMRAQTPWTAVVLSGALGLALAVCGVVLAVHALRPARSGSSPKTASSTIGVAPSAAGGVPTATIAPIATITTVATIAPPPDGMSVPSSVPGVASSAPSASSRPSNAVSSNASPAGKPPAVPLASGQPSVAPARTVGARPSKPSTTVDLGY
jgi:serine/threonine-protein kinase